MRTQPEMISSTGALMTSLFSSFSVATDGNARGTLALCSGVVRVMKQPATVPYRTASHHTLNAYTVHEHCSMHARHVVSLRATSRRDIDILETEKEREI